MSANSTNIQDGVKNTDSNAQIPLPLALPAPESGAQTLEVGSTVKLDRLGPMVVNSDGVRHIVLYDPTCG